MWKNSNFVSVDLRNVEELLEVRVSVWMDLVVVKIVSLWLYIKNLDG